ncbi:hypothetical protein AGMMS49992_16580 [Clostridia bacterium]|nr:hypothetical protein AGMMS49992_16580 [Clostridia bacterium]
MNRKSVVLFVIAASCFVAAINGFKSGSVGGGVIALLFAAGFSAFAFLQRRKQQNSQQNIASIQTPYEPSGDVSQYDFDDDLMFKIVGVSFKNDDGTSRQDILARNQRLRNKHIDFAHMQFKDEPAYGVFCNGEQIGHIKRDDIVDFERAKKSGYDHAHLSIRHWEKGYYAELTLRKGA